MKQKLLLFAALLCGCLTASAQWTRPVPATTDFSSDTLYLYNTGAQMFWTQGNAWGTQVSVADTAIAVTIQPYIDPELAGEDSVWDGITYVIFDYPPTKGKWMNAFIDSETQMYVDRGSQANWFFQFEKNSDGTFKMYGADVNPTYNQANYANCYIGVVEKTDGTFENVVSPILDITQISDEENQKAYHTTWALVTPAAYATYVEKVGAYNAAVALASAIETAEAAGVTDLSSEKAVYNNTSSTQEQLEAAAASAKDKTAKIYETTYSPSNPLDMTKDYVIDYEFNETNGSKEWLYTTGAQNHGTATNMVSVAGADGEYHFEGTFWENWNPSAFTGKLYRQMTNMPHGVYRLGLAAFTNNGEGSYVYINADSAESATGLPEAYEVMGLIVDTDTVEIGLAVVTAANWVGIDNASLIYYGNSAESWAYLMSEKVKVNDYSDYTYYSKAAEEEYQAVVAATANPSNETEAKEFISQYDAAWKAFKANIDAYAELEDAIAAGNDANEKFPNDDLGDALMDIEEKLQGGEMTTEEALAEAAALRELTEYAIKNPTPGQEVTVLLTNANFDQAGSIGWKVDQTTVENATATFPQQAGLAINPNGERWNANFDYYQTLSDMPNGVYKLQAQAFYRTGSNAAAESGRADDEILEWIYVNDTKATVKNIMYTGLTADQITSISDVISNCYQRTDTTANMDGETVIYTPNGQNSASVFFQYGLYDNEVYGIVTDGNLRIGVKSEGTISDRWSLFDNFRLYYEGYDEDILSSLLENGLVDARALTEEPMATATLDELNSAISTAESALSGDGETMFNAYNTLVQASKTAENSVSLYEDLTTVADNLNEAIEKYQETAEQSVVDEATEYLDEINEALGNYSWTDAEVEEGITKGKGYITKLGIPAGTASVAEPLDYSSLIENAAYDENSNDGWSGTTPGFQTYDDAEFYNTNFDYYQTITGLPEGAYKVNVYGYYRPGYSNSDDYNTFLTEPETLAQNAVMYAINGEWTGEDADLATSTPLQFIYTGAVEESFGGGTSSVASGLVVPNNMEAAAAWFDNGYYVENSIILWVGSDGVLTIGLRKSETITGDWTIFDDWSLTYYGNGSDAKELVENQATAIESVTETSAETVATEIFTIGGARVNALQKGVNIVKRIAADGSVKVSKVLVK